MLAPVQSVDIGIHFLFYADGGPPAYYDIFPKQTVGVQTPPVCIPEPQKVRSELEFLNYESVLNSITLCNQARIKDFTTGASSLSCKGETYECRKTARVLSMKFEIIVQPETRIFWDLAFKITHIYFNVQLWNRLRKERNHESVGGLSKDPSARPLDGTPKANAVLFTKGVE